MPDAKIDTGRARASILEKVRKSLGAGADEIREARVEKRMTGRAAGIVPERGNGDADAKRALLRSMMEAADTSVDEVGNIEDVPSAIVTYLKDRNLPMQVRMGEDPLLAAAGWSSEPLLDVSGGRAEPSDLVSVSAAFSAVAESGTLVLHAGADNPTTLNFLPENHIVVVRADDIEGNYEAVWSRLRGKFGDAEMPRVVNMVSGPSRTGDIEQTILLGAHGPKSLHLIIVR